MCGPVDDQRSESCRGEPPSERKHAGFEAWVAVCHNHEVGTAISGNLEEAAAQPHASMFEGDLSVGRLLRPADTSETCYCRTADRAKECSARHGIATVETHMALVADESTPGVALAKRWA